MYGNISWVEAELVSLCIQISEPLILWGMDGEAKTASATAIAEALGYHVETVILGNEMPADLAGIPVKVEHPESGEMVVVKVPKKPFYDAMARQERSEKTVIFWDESNQSTPLTQAVWQNILSTWKVGPLQFDRNFVSFISAANPPGIATGARNFKPPVCTRMMHAKFELPREVWLFGETHGWPTPSPQILPENWEKNFTPAARGLVTGFIGSPGGVEFYRETPENVTNWSRGVPRTWSRVRRVCAALLSLDAGDSLWRLALQGIIPSAIEAFMEYRTLTTMVSVPDVLADPEGCEIPARRDLAAALCSGLFTEVSSIGTVEAFNKAAIFAKRLYDSQMGECCGPGMLRLAGNFPRPKKGEKFHPAWATWRPLGKALASRS